MEGLVIIIAVLYSIIFHELAHGYVADFLGDYTPRYSGRLTLNPIMHLDPIGSIMLPIFTFLTGGFIFGWAKPVPINPFNFKNPKRDMALVGIAGPLTNIVLALILALFFKLLLFLNIPLNQDIFFTIIRINLILAIFNLLPIPPLDGSRVFLSFLPLEKQIYLEQFGIIFIFIFIFFAFPLIIKIVDLLLNLIL
ncbi:MAG: site-2 protease family protein [Minisyncoccia bacterium]